MIISHKHKFIWSFPIGHTASTSLFESLKYLHDDPNFFTAEWHEEIISSPSPGLQKPILQNFGFHPDIQHYTEVQTSNPYTKMPNEKYLNKHINVLNLLDNGFPEDLFNDYVKIAVVRNPYTRFAAGLIKDRDFTANTRVSLNTGRRYFNFWLKKKNQCGLLGKVDYRLINFESLDSDLRLLKTEGILPNDFKLLHIRKPKDSNLSGCARNLMNVFYSDATFIDWFHSVFDEDFRRLNYKKELL